MQYDSNNVFAKIIAGDIPAKKVYEDEAIVAIEDIAPAAPIHILVLPKKAYIDYTDFITQATAEEIKYYFTKVAVIAEELGLSKDGYRLITNKGTLSGQTVFHFHTHIIAGKKLDRLV